MNQIDLDKLYKFEDLQKASCILRKALKEIRTLTNGSNQCSTSNSLNLSSSSSSNNSSICNRETIELEDEINENCLTQTNNNVSLAFDNLTYLSSIEDLTQTRQQTSTNQNEVFKKTLKSIKRKDKLKKIPVNNNDIEEDINDNAKLITKTNLKHAKSMPVLWIESQVDAEENTILSNNEYEKQLRKLFRNKSLNRSLRRAKSVYYRNRRSKSLEDLNLDEKINFLLNTSSSYLKLNKRNSKNMSRCLSITSSCSSTGLASDISSSYFHELSDWSPEFSSSESDSSEDELFNNFDWDADFSGVNLSEYNSSDDSDEDENEQIVESKENINEDTSNKTKEEEECLKEILSQKLENDADTIEKMFNEVMFRMLKIHPDIMTESNSTQIKPECLNNNLKSFQINAQYLNNKANQQKCLICKLMFDHDEDVASLNCSHTFHLNCLQIWTSKSSCCPSCRTSISNRSNGFLNETRLIQKRETLL